MTNLSGGAGPQPVGAAQFVAPFTITDGPVQQFLGQHLMKVPEIQRPYAWKLENAEELVRDLEKLEAARLQGNAQPQHYLGTLVVITYANQRDEIVDGQQRLTTISVLVGQLLRALKELAQKAAQKAATNNNQTVKQSFLNIEQNCRNRITILGNLLQIQNGINPNTQQPIYEPRILVSPEIVKTYTDLIEGGDGLSAIGIEDKKPAQDLRRIATYLYEKFVTGPKYSKLQEADQFNHLDNRANQVTLGLIWVRLSTQYANAAAELFESLNARGRPLNVLGLIKVWLLGTLKQVNATSTLVSQVASDFRSLSDDDDEIAVKYFLDFYRMRALEDVKKNKTPKEISLLAREKLFRDPVLAPLAKAANPTQIAQLIGDEVALMKKLWPTWDLLVHGAIGAAPKMRSLSRLPAVCAATPNPAWVNSRLHLLLDKQWLSHQIIYPFLTAAADHLASTNQLNVFEDVVHDVEKFFFRAKSVCDIDPKEINALYFKQLEQLKLFQRLNVPLLRQEMQGLLAKHAPDQLFVKELVRLCVYGKGKGTELAKYFLSMLETYAYCPPGQPNVPMTPQKGQNLLNLRDWQLEHIVPQNPRPGGHTLHVDEVDRLGNLCLLPPDWNQHLTNSDYIAKRQLVSARIKTGHNLQVVDSNDVFTNQLFANTQWTSVEVVAREKKLVAKALAIFVI